MKQTEQLKPNHGPIYAAALYPDLVSICQKHGYALACHGSLARDLDLIAIPWAEKYSKPAEVIHQITKDLALTLDSGEKKLHGRIAVTLICGFGNCVIDLSFITPVVLEKQVSIPVRNPIGDIPSGINIGNLVLTKEAADQIGTEALMRRCSPSIALIFDENTREIAEVAIVWPPINNNPNHITYFGTL